MIRERAELRKTPIYRMEFFSDGDLYYVDADLKRFQTIENQLDALLRITGGGILKGWEVFQKDNGDNLSLAISPGIGIIPFVQDKIDPETREKVFDPNTGEIIRETYYLAIRTRTEINIPNSVGLNRRSVVYVGLNPEAVRKIQSQDFNENVSSNELIDWDDFTEITISPSVTEEEFPGRTGPYRNTTPSPNNIDFPIKNFIIDGEFNPNTQKVVAFVNGKPYYDGFTINGRTVVFENPLHKEDVVTVRIEPRYGLALADIESDDTEIIKIDNSIRVSAFTKSADGFIYRSLLEHNHTGTGSAPEKILLTTETGLIGSTINTNNLVYTFNKEVEGSSFSEYYGFAFDSGTYDIDVYINGFINTDPVTIVDNGNQIVLTFAQELDSTDTVQVILYIKNSYTQIKNKLIVSRSNPSQEKIDVEISGSSIKTGTLSKDLIPRLSHVGISSEIMKPTNPPDGSEENVHYTENLDFNFLKEFFPVYNKKTNARKSLDIFAEPKVLPGDGVSNPSKQIIHVCGSNGILYKEVPFEETQKTSETRKGFILGSKAGKYHEGWKNINFDVLSSLKEFDVPFGIFPVKTAGSPSSNNWDIVFAVSRKFVIAISWSNLGITSTSNPVPRILQVLNTTGDVPSDINSNNPYYSKIDEIGGIVDAVSGRGILNLEKTVYILAENRKVYCFDYVDNQYTWVDVTSEINWTSSASNIFSLTYDESNLSNDILFVGDGSTLYFNSIGKRRVVNTINSGVNQIYSITFEPSNVWDGNTNQLLSDGDRIVLFGNRISEKAIVSTVSYSTTSPYYAQIALTSALSKTYAAKSGSFYRSGFIKDWSSNPTSFAGTPQKAIFYDSRLFILTTSNLYVSDSVFSSIDDVNYSLSSLTFSVVFSSNKDLNDIEAVNDVLIVAAEDGIYKLSFNYSSIPVPYTESKNSQYVTTINDLLYPANKLYVNNTISSTEDVIFSLGKYGIFQSTDKGESWRNSIQILGQPENKSFIFSSPKEYLRIVGKDSTKNRIYVVKDGAVYGYGYGYGYGLGDNYFDVFNFESFEYGYGIGNFEQDYAFDYGYGFGNELADAVSGLSAGDWIYYPDNAGGAYETNPLRILGFGIENNQNYIDIEQGDGYPADFDIIPLNLVVEIYPKIEPLPLINEIPQSSLYETTNIENYSFDPFRQSIKFDNLQNIDNKVKIASKYKNFTIIENFDLISRENNNTFIKLNGIDLKDYWTRSNDVFRFDYSFNIDDILKLTVAESHITDVGINTHKDIEDNLSLETVGLEYEFDGVRTSNFLQLMMQLKHKFKDSSEFSSSTAVSVTIDSFGSASGTNNPWIQDSTTTYAPNAFVGRFISFNKNGKNYRFTISSNTMHKFYIQRVYSYEYFVANGTSSSFNLQKGNGQSGTFTIFKNGVELSTSDFTEVLSGGGVVSIILNSTPVSGDNIFIKYVDTLENFDISSLFDYGQTITIDALEESLISKTTNVFVSNYREEDFIIDLDRSFIENSIYLENATDIGDVDYTLFYVFSDSVLEKFYAGTDRGVWTRDFGSIIFTRSGVILNTLNPIGNLTLGDQIDGAYIEYDIDTQEWTVTWGGQPVLKDINFDISRIKVNSVVAVNDKIGYAGTDRGFYRTLSGSADWKYIWNTVSDQKTSSNPEIFQIVVDDKHPWIINAILESGLYRSYDYGNNWIHLDGADQKYTAFAYQKDSSDSRSVYYYGRDSLNVKKYSSETALTYPYDTREIKTDLAFGSNFVSSFFTKILNDPNNVDKVYFGLDFLGVYKSELLGGSNNLARTNFYNNNYGLALVSSGFSSIGIEKTGALNDSYSSNIFYSLYVSPTATESPRMFLQMNVDPVVAKVLDNHKFAGHLAKLPDGKYYKIVDNYDRGPTYQLDYHINSNDESRDFRIVEFILEGAYEYYPDRDGANRDDNTGDYWYETSQPFGSGFIQNTISISFLKESNGEDSRVRLSSFGQTVYAVKSTIWTDGITDEDETVLIVDYDTLASVPAAYVSDDALQNYYVGNPESGLLYKVYNSKILNSGDQYYDNESASARGHLALRLEKKEDVEEANWNTLYRTEDPYYLWHRFFGTELNNNWRAVLVDPGSSNPAPDFYNDFEYDFTNFNSEKVFSDGSEGRTYMVFDDLFESGKNQACVLLSYEDETSTAYENDNDLRGYIIKDPSTTYEYEITASKKLTSGDTYYNSNYHRIQCRIERYDGSYDNGVDLYSDGSYDDIQGDRIRLINREGLNDRELQGASIYFDKRPFVTFKVKEIDGDYIVVDRDTLDDLIEGGEELRCRYRIDERVAKDLAIRSSFSNLYVVGEDYIYTDKSSSGQRWYAIFDGLDIEENSKTPYAKFNSVYHDDVGNYLYAASSTLNYSGIYVHNTATTNITFTRIAGDSDTLSDKSISSIDLYRGSSNLIILVGTEDDGVYKGVSSGLDPIASSWTWTKINFPESNVSTIEAIVDQDADIDLDRIWVGTEGSGIFKRDEDSTGVLDSSWIGNIPSEVISKDINSSEWRVWRVEKDASETNPIVLEEDEFTVYKNVSSPGVSTAGIFDWEKSYVYDEDLGLLYYILDPANINYTTDSYSYYSRERWNSNRFLSESSRQSHRFHSALTSSVSNNEVRIQRASKGGFSSVYDPNTKTFFKMDFMFNYGVGESVYEEPFKHGPDKNSIIKILPINSGNEVAIITDRDGIYLSGSTDRFLLPDSISDKSTPDSYGYTFSQSSFDSSQDILIEYPGYRYTNDGANDFFDNIRFNRLFEKLFMFEVDQTTQPTAYSDISSFLSTHGSDALVGSYMVVSQGNISEISGPNNPKSFLVRSIEHVTSPANLYKIQLSIGRLNISKDVGNGFIFENINFSSYGDIGSQWQNGINFTGYTKFFFLDAQAYTKVDITGLPTFNAIDMDGNSQLGIFVRDAVKDQFDGIYLACGSGGVYYCSDVTGVSPTWSQVTGSENIYAISLAYKGSILSFNRRLYVGTPNEGVHQLNESSGVWTLLTGLDKHPHVWCLLSDSSGDLYAGTEHGGVYKLNGSAFERMQGGTRSKLLTWKTTGVPVNKGNNIFDYSQSDNLLSYAYGGGIMVSRDRGSSWEQANNGLENFYVQDVAISSGSDSHETAYVATCGGGLFKTTNAFSESGGETTASWTQCSLEGLPRTLNISEVSVGVEPDTVYIKCIVNDFSLKDLPYRLRKRNYFQPPLNSDAIGGAGYFMPLLTSIYGFPENLKNDANGYTPYFPYEYGARKHVIYRSTDGGNTWTNVYDIELVRNGVTQTNFKAENGIYGLEVVPGESNIIKFVSNYLIEYREGSVNYSLNKMAYTTLSFDSNNDVTFTEKEIPAADFRLLGTANVGLSPSYAISDGFLSINPKNTDEVFFTVGYRDVFERGKKIPILYSSDNGDTWERRVSLTGYGIAPGFNTEIQFSTRPAENQNIDFSVSYLSANSGELVVDGVYQKRGYNEESFLWDSVSDLAKVDNTFVDVNFQFDENRLNLFLDSNLVVRPFTLEGAILIPDYSNNPNSEYTIFASGCGEYYHRRTFGSITPQRVTMKLNDVFNADSLNVGESTISRLKNLTSFKIPFSEVATNTILGKENLLINRNITFGSNSYKIAFHRVYDDPILGVKYVELILIGNASSNLSGNFSINIERPIYSNYNNKVYVSINKGLSWVEVDSVFGFNGFKILDIEPVDGQYIGSTYDRVFFAAFKVGEDYKLRLGTIDDTRYTDGIRSPISWTDISYPTSTIGNILEGGLKFVDNGISQYLYITSSDTIIRKRVSSFTADFLAGDWEIVFRTSQITYPLVVSETDNNRMAFIAAGNIYVSRDAFASETPDYTGEPLPGEDSSSYNVTRMILNPSGENEDEILISINNSREYDSASAYIISVNVAEDVNELLIAQNTVSGPNPFLPQTDWVGKPVVLRSNTTNYPYSSKLIASQNNVIALLPTLNFDLTSATYDALTNETRITGNLNGTLTTSIGDYSGNIFVCYTDTVTILTGRVPRITFNAGTGTLILKGDYTGDFSTRNVDFINTTASMRVGSVRDILGFSGILEPENFGIYAISSSKPSFETSQNGIYLSGAFGSDWNQISISDSEEFVDGCIDVTVNENKSINVVVTDENSTRIFVNDSWLPSGNIKKVDVDSSGNTYFITDNGYSRVSLDLDFLDQPVFENYSFKNYKDFILYENDIVLVDQDDNIYVNEKDDFTFNGNEVLSIANSSIKNINKIVKDSNNIYWVATESEGVRAISSGSNQLFGPAEIGTSTVFDIYEDNLNRIWLALGDDGVAVISYVYSNGQITNYTIENYNEESGFQGSVRAITQINGLNYISQGSLTPASILLSWANNSNVYPNTILTRSRSEVRPKFEDKIYNFNQITGIIFSIESTTIESGGSNVPVWKIVARNFSSTSGQSISTNSLANKYMLYNSRESDSYRKVVANGSDIIYIERIEGESAITGEGKYFLIAEKIEDENSFVLFTGNSDIINSTFTDFSIINSSTYYYYLDFYDSNGVRVAIDSKRIAVSPTSQNTENSSKILIATDNGIWSFEGGSTPFQVKSQFNEAEDVTDIFVNTSNILYVSAGSVLIEITDNGRTDLGKSDLFGDKLSSLPSSTMEVRNVVEGPSQELIIATNLGLSIRTSDNDFTSFIANDPSIVYRKNNIFQIEYWRPVQIVNNDLTSSKFIKSDEVSVKYYLASDTIWKTENDGKNWGEVLQLPESVNNIYPVTNSSGNIIDYILISNSNISSTSQNTIEETFDFFDNRESISAFDRVSGEGSAAHIYLSEPSSDAISPKLFAGIFDNRILEEEKEIFIFDFASISNLNQDPVEVTSSSIGALEGLAIQSVYRIVEDTTGNRLFAGAKDSILKFDLSSSDPWVTLELVENNDSEESVEYCYTDLLVRTDATALETGTIVYGTRSRLFGGVSHDFVIIRPDESNLDDRITSVDLRNSFIKRLSWVDHPGRSSYFWENSHIHTVGNHRGALYFMDSVNHILIGGFDNKLFLIPFTVDTNNQIRSERTNLSCISGRRYKDATQFPITSQADTWSQILSFDAAEKYDTKFMPRNSWGISYLKNSSNEEEAYMSCFLFGQNQNYFESFYQYTPESDTAFIYKSYMSDMMFWEPFVKPDQPNGIISDFKYYDGDLYATSIYGAGSENIGLFKIDSSAGWEKQNRSASGDEQQYFNIPVNKLKVYENELIIPTLGFGIQKYDGSNYSSLNSRFFTQYGVEYGRWNVTSISQDPNNQNRVVVGTADRGLMLGVYSSNDAKWKWSVEQFGFENGSITAVEILPVNSDIILVGVANDGLYRKDAETKLYSKATSGLPTTGDVVQIKVNNYVSNVESSIPVENNGNNILIIRSIYENPKEDPVNGTEYELNDEIFNAEVIYIGTDAFSENLFIDRDITLKSGVPYFYRVYDIGLGNVYTERDLITGRTSDVRKLYIQTQGDTFGARDLTGRIAVVNTVLVKPLAFEIASNSYDASSGISTVNFIADKYRVINQGNADLFDRAVVPYRIESTLLERPRIVRPIWIVYKEDGSSYSKIYISNDNGIQWIDRSSNIPSDADIYNIEISETNETRNFIKHILYASTSKGIYQSTDDGVSWSKISIGTNGLLDTSYSEVLVDTGDYRIIYAVTTTGLLYRSIDFGSSWEYITNFGSGANDYTIVSEFDNSIFVGSDIFGIRRYYDPVREEFLVQIDSDGKITNVIFDEFEMGDEIFTDSNTIIAKTYPKNDNTFKNYEQVKFKVDDKTRYVTFRFNKRSSSFDLDEIRIGDDLVNPETIPFILQNPAYDDGYIKINKIGSLDSDENFIISNKGIHTTSNSGITWQKLTSSFIPNDVRDLIASRDGSILLGTNNGLWGSDSDRKNYRNIEQDNFEVNTIWESFERGVRRIFRGGERGLYITVERPLSKTIVTYSGDLSQSEGIQFSWGDISNPRDGGWTERTENILSQSVWARPSSSSSLQEYKGWDAALIMRYGPFTTFEKAESYANNSLWLPVNGAEYPDGFANTSRFEFGQSAVYRNPSSSLLLEESSNQIRFTGVDNPVFYHTNGVINIGHFPNVNSPNNYPVGNNYPKTDFPIVDSVDAAIGENRRVGVEFSPTEYLENYADIRAYESYVSGGDSMTNEELLTAIRADSTSKKQLAPRLFSNMYYAYRVFPYRLIPDPTLVTNSGAFVPTPRYRAASGDLVESYSFIIDIRKFVGANKILTGTSTLSGNWIVGTDGGLFYSTENGQNVVKSESLSSSLVGYKFISILYTSSNVVLAVAVSNTLDDIRFIRNTSDFTNNNFDSNWEFLNDLSEFLKNVGINVVFNLEESEGKIYASTNKGIVLGEENGTNWKFLGRVGDLESSTESKVLGQEFKVE